MSASCCYTFPFHNNATSLLNVYSLNLRKSENTQKTTAFTHYIQGKTRQEDGMTILIINKISLHCVLHCCLIVGISSSFYRMRLTILSWGFVSLACLSFTSTLTSGQRPSALSGGGGLRPLLGLTLRQQLQAGQPPVPRFDCNAEHTGFELVTGFVFSSPADLLDSQPGTLMLADCLEACRLNSSCRAANYETGKQQNG